jgi:hypothetical protein
MRGNPIRMIENAESFAFMIETPDGEEVARTVPAVINRAEANNRQ